MNSDTTDHATLTLAAREDAALLAATMLIAAKRYMADAEAYRAWALRNLAATEEDKSTSMTQTLHSHRVYAVAHQLMVLLPMTSPTPSIDRHRPEFAVCPPAPPCTACGAVNHDGTTCPVCWMVGPG